MEKHNMKLQKKYREIEENEVRFEKFNAMMPNMCLLLMEPVHVFARNQSRFSEQKELKSDFLGLLHFIHSLKICFENGLTG